MDERERAELNPVIGKISDVWVGENRGESEFKSLF